MSIRMKFSLFNNKKSSFLNIDTQIPSTGITAIFGRSGSGKTSLLRCVAGLEQSKQGRLIVNDVCWQDEHTFLPAHTRPIGYVFQEASLFSHLTALKNLNYAIKRSDHPVSPDFYQRVINVLGIASILTQYPHQLSGGERQRIAIARALLIQPRLLLMDEPLAALDHQRKQEIIPYLERVHQSFAIPILYVSHSMDEVARLADHILVLDKGEVIAEGALTDVFSRIDLPPQLEQESGVILNGRVVEKDSHWKLMKVAFANRDIWIPDSEECLNQIVRVRILAKDVSLSLNKHDDTSIINRIPATIMAIKSDQGKTMSLVKLEIGTEYLVAKMTQKSVHHLNLCKNMKVWAQIKSVALIR